MSKNTRYIKISAVGSEDRLTLYKKITISWKCSTFNILKKHKVVTYGGNTGHTFGFVYPTFDVHGMMDISEDDSTDTQYNAEIGYSTGLIALPHNYSQTGKPVDVIVLCHSSSGYHNIDDMEFMSSYAQYYQYLRDEGYAIVDFWGHSSFAPVTANRPRVYGNPDNMMCYQEGIKWVMDNFNVNPRGIFVTCKSLGGTVGLNLAFNSTSTKVLACGMLAPALNNLRRSMGYTKEERFENAWAFGFEGDTDTILGDESIFVDYGTIPKEDEAYKSYIKNNAHKMLGYMPMWNGVIGCDLDKFCEWGFNLGAGDYLQENWGNYSRVCNTPIKIWVAKDDVNTPYDIASNFINTLKNGGCIAELRTMPTGTGAHYSVDNGTESNPSIKVARITTRLGIEYTNIPLAYVELVNYFRRFSS